MTTLLSLRTTDPARSTRMTGRGASGSTPFGPPIEAPQGVDARLQHMTGVPDRMIVGRRVEPGLGLGEHFLDECPTEGCLFWYDGAGVSVRA
jgi:hypothetical protein